MVDLPLRILILFLSSLLLLLVIELTRKEKLTFKYAIGWLFVCVLAILLTVFEAILSQIAHALGFQLVSNFIFFTLLSVFVFLCLLLTVFLCQQDKRNNQTAQKIGMLEFELKELKNQKGMNKKDSQ